jgi:hypothetical protein
MKKIISILIILFLFFSAALFFFAFQNFLGNKIFYFSFTVISFFSLIYSFRKNGFFIEKFFIIYLWLGFWLKFSLFQGLFINDPPGGLGNFNFTKDSFSELMVISSLPFAGVTISSIILNRISFLHNCLNNNFLQRLYDNLRSPILISITFLILIVSVLNYKFGIYQKGLIPTSELPFLISGFFKWLYLMGFGVILSLLIKYELDSKKDVQHQVYLIVILESFVSNFALLSRAMIFNVSSIFYGLFKSLKFNEDYKKKIIKFFFYYILILILFLTSIPIINEIRNQVYYQAEKIEIDKKKHLHVKTSTLGIQKIVNTIKKNKFISYFDDKNVVSIKIFKALQLVYIRFVGIESLMAVSSYEKLGFFNFKEAFDEKINYSNYNHYYLKYNLLEKEDSNVKFLEDKKDLQEKQYTIHIPGIVAFLYYSGSKVFLFFSIFILSIIFYSFERFVYFSSSGNLILTAFVSHIISYRLAHFGYVPTQSYLFFGALLTTIFTIFLFNKFFK